MTHTLFIPCWHPSPLNQIMRGHWSRGHRLKKADRQVVAAYALGVPKAEGPRRVTVTLVLRPRQRGVDPDGIQKSTGDALVACGLLLDDNRQGVVWEPVKYERGDAKSWGTRIELEDL